MSKHETIYRLSEDTDKIKKMQNASLNSEFGLKLTGGIVVASDDWWKAVDEGKVKLLRSEGTIKSIDGGPMKDWPTVRIEEYSGEKKSWNLYGAISRNIIDKGIIVEYVKMEPKKPPFPNYLVNLIISISIEK